MQDWLSHVFDAKPDAMRWPRLRSRVGLTAQAMLAWWRKPRCWPTCGWG